MRQLKTLPDVLVLGAGGTLGIAWLRGIVTGISEATGLDLRGCEYFVGTSAGAFVAAQLAAGKSLEDPGVVHDAAVEAGDAEPPSPVRKAAVSGARVAAAATAPFVPLALRATRAPGELARAAILRTAKTGRAGDLQLGRYLAGLGSFDGRLRLATVDRATGKRVMFGAPRAPEASVADAVRASCSVPWMFAPVQIGGREYVDGGVWSMSNLDAAPARRGAEILALLPTFGRGAGGGVASLLRAAGQAAGLAELQVLRTRGAQTRVVAPDAGAIAAIGPNLRDPGRRAKVYAAGRAQGRLLGG